MSRREPARECFPRSQLHAQDRPARFAALYATKRLAIKEYTRSYGSAGGMKGGATRRDGNYPPPRIMHLLRRSRERRLRKSLPDGVLDTSAPDYENTVEARVKTVDQVGIASLRNAHAMLDMFKPFLPDVARANALCRGICPNGRRE